MPLFALTIFVSAFLLFQVQPLLGKYILPWFGSTPSVWTTCLLFFQTLLLCGYCYSHLVISKLSVRRQAAVHVLLLGASLMLLPITPAQTWKMNVGGNPAWRILALLAVSVGGPYLLVATSAPLLQAWFACLHPDRSPYRLYAVSNTGSLLALLSYPLFFERYLRLETQTRAWSAGYVGLAFLLVLCLRRLLKAAPGEHPASVAQRTSRQQIQSGGGGNARTGIGRIMLWLVLSALGSTMLLATTNRMTLDVPAVPLLFVLPLSIYLVTFIIAFDNPRWYCRPLFCALLPLAIAGALVEIRYDLDLGLHLRIGLFSLALFSCCMSCHGEMTRLKPDPTQLTLFYLTVALGGALGGVNVGLLAPNILSGYWEYEMCLACVYVLVTAMACRDLRKTIAENSEKRAAGFALKASIGATAALTTAAVAVGVHRCRAGENVIVQRRNFYGVVKVVEEDREQPRLHKYGLMHGHVRHGFQYLHPEKRAWPTSYFGEESGVGLAIRCHPLRMRPGRPFRLGVLGLGAGTLSAYANHREYKHLRWRVTDYVRFYEIDPQVVKLARESFTFLADAEKRGAVVDVVVGDGRIAMESELARGESQQFDVLVIDAFTGDAVPMHLLTAECFRVYLAHLREGGVLALHISNRYLDLLPVVRTLAEDAGMEFAFIRDQGDDYGHSASRWVLVTNSEDFLSNGEVLRALLPQPSRNPKIVRWTDDFSSLVDVLD